MILMTMRERDALHATIDHLSERGRLPSVRELARRIGHSKHHSTAHRLVQGLRDRGIITGHGRPKISAMCFKYYRYDATHEAFSRVF